VSTRAPFTDLEFHAQDPIHRRDRVEIDTAVEQRRQRPQRANCRSALDLPVDVSNNRRAAMTLELSCPKGTVVFKPPGW